MDGGVRQVVTGVPPPDLLRLICRRKESFGLCRENGAIPTAVDHEQWATSKCSYAAKRIRDRSNQLREWEIRKIATGCQHKRSRGAIALGDCQRELGPERVPDDAKSFAVDLRAGGQKSEREVRLRDRRAPSLRKLERVSH